MLTAAPNVGSRLLHAIASACGQSFRCNPRFTLATSCPGNDAHAIGVCLSGAHMGKTLYVCLNDAHEVGADAQAMTVVLHMLEGNPLGLKPGAQMVLSVGNDECDEDVTSWDRIGLAFDAQLNVLPVDIGLNGAAPTAGNPKKQRSQLKPVVMPDGITLTRENSARAFVAWLTKCNEECAGKFGLEKLVWCEEVQSSRVDRNQVRVFYRYDVNDGMRKKTCANVNAAIDYIQAVTKRDFYEEMLSRGHDFEFDMA